MNSVENLSIAKTCAENLLVEQFDSKHSIPMRATSHTDLWPGDRWAEAYVAAGENNLAAAAYEKTIRSIRPDGSVPHLLQGSHKRLKVETNWIDRQVYKLQGAGAMKLDNGEHVTRNLHAFPSWALGALALHQTNENYFEGTAVRHGQRITPMLVRATRALYSARGNEDGLIVSEHRDELTNNAGKLSKEGLPLIDPATNALFVLNNKAVEAVASATDTQVPSDLKEKMDQTYENTFNLVNTQLDKKSKHPETILAAARLSLIYEDTDLSDIYATPDLEDKHPERSRLSLAESLEIARLTPERADSVLYIGRICTAVAQTGKDAITRFEDVKPSKNPATNKLYRSHIWLPTAAEIVQIGK